MSDRAVRLALAGMIVGVPLALGGEQPLLTLAAALVAVALLAVTIRRRAAAGGGPGVPGLSALAAFAGLALLTTVPLPAVALRVLSPATAALYGEMLPGWPADGTWRPLALDPYAVWTSLAGAGVGVAVYAVLLGFPWREGGVDGGPMHIQVSGGVLLALLLGGALVALATLLLRAAGYGSLAAEGGTSLFAGRASGPFRTPDLLAAHLGMLIPVAAAYGFAVARRFAVRFRSSADMPLGLAARSRAVVSTLTVNQARLWPPAAAALLVLTMLAAHAATGSPGGRAALLLGLAITAMGLAAPAVRHRRLGTAAAACLLFAGAGVAGLWIGAEARHPAPATAREFGGFASRLAVTEGTAAVVRHHALVGTGLGSWPDAFRRHRTGTFRQPVAAQAASGYLELTAEVGLIGLGLIVLFALAVRRAFRVPRSAVDGDLAVADWRAALADAELLRWGLVGGMAVCALHSILDAPLRAPANLLVLMTLLALLVAGGAAARLGAGRALGSLAALLAIALVPLLASLARGLTGAPLSPGDLLARAQAALGEGETGRDAARALIERAVLAAPARSAVHHAAATVLGPGPAGDAALARALALDPWSCEIRDALAVRLWQRGERSAGLVEFEESMARCPSFAEHAYLFEGASPVSTDGGGGRTLAAGDPLAARLGALDPQVGDAVGRGLVRALAGLPAGPGRLAVAAALATVREAQGHLAGAATMLAEEAERAPDEASKGMLLARAARDWLRAGDLRAAERVFVAAIRQAPERGDLYRRLAVDIYAARGDYATADGILQAGQRHAADPVPVYRGVLELLAQREAAKRPANTAGVGVVEP
jgi:hypothetical protein